MPASVLAMLAAGLLSIVWPGPKMDHVPPASGGVFAPHFVESEFDVVISTYQRASIPACVDIIEDTTTHKLRGVACDD